MSETSSPLYPPALSYINGEWVPAFSGDTFDVLNPYSQEVIAQVPNMDRRDCLAAIEAANHVAISWREMLPSQRAKLLMNWHDLILEHRDELARLMVTEQGKPLPEARGEIVYGASFIKWFAEEAVRAYGSIIPPFAQGRRLLVIRQAVGVVAAITPWNFPHAMITRKCAPALAAGCPVVIKPAEDTPLSALALAALAEKAGFPRGVFNVVTTDRAGAGQVGETLCLDTRIRKVGFTGSTTIGKHVMAQAASTVKRVSLELGGNAPLIIFDDARLDLALRGVFVSKFRNAGQTCICANRIFVHRARMEEVTHSLIERAERFHLGNGLDASVDMGPLINERAVDRVSQLVKTAVEQGAKLLTGGTSLNQELSPDPKGPFWAPTILSNVSNEMEIAQLELFAPIVTLIPFEDDAEVIRMANDTPFGLAAYFFTEDHRRIWRVAEALEYGMVAVNDGALSTAVAPFGGVKESGIGREGSRWGLDEFQELKYIMLGGLHE